MRDTYPEANTPTVRAKALDTEKRRKKHQQIYGGGNCQPVSCISHQFHRSPSLQQKHPRQLALRSGIPIRPERADTCQPDFSDLPLVCCQAQEGSPFLWGGCLPPWKLGTFREVPFLLHYLVTVPSAHAHPPVP